MASSYGDVYSSSKYNPKKTVPTSSRPGGSIGANQWATEPRSERVYDKGSQYYHGYTDFFNQMAMTQNQGPGPSGPLGPGGGGGGGGWGGGGGGGGAPAMTQAQFDMMLKLLGTGGPKLNLKKANLPTFRGQQITPFNNQLYTQMQGRLNQAVAADRGDVNRVMGQLTTQLTNDYSNPFQNAAYATTPVMQAQMQAAMATAGGNPLNSPYAESVNAENAYSQSSDAAFGNLMNVLAATNQQDQSSRLAQVGMDRAEALSRINAAELGLGTGIDLAQGKAKEAWQQRADERRYQNSLTRQQWNREERMRNQDVRNLERQKMYETEAGSRDTRLQAVLDMIARTAGTNVNITGIDDLIARWKGSVGPAPKAGKGKGKAAKPQPRGGKLHGGKGGAAKGNKGKG